MRHKGCTEESEIVYYCFRCGQVWDAPKVRAVLDAAKTLEKYETVDYPGITSWNDAVDVLIEAVRDLKKSEAKE